MGWKNLAALAALACACGPAAAFDLGAPAQGVMFYVSVPLEGRAPSPRTLAFGMQVRGERAYEVVTLDTRMLNFLGTGIEAKWIIASVVAAGATIAVTQDKNDPEPEQPPPPCQNTSSSCR
jgi:hypothetical protein